MTFGPRLAAVAVAVAAALASPAAALAECAAAPAGDHVTFADVGTFELRVPAGIDRVTVDARGGHGGQEDRTATGGRGGRVAATLPVTPGECLEIFVGDYGYPDGGFGFGYGGARGTQSAPTAYNGAGGGGASAVLRGGTPLVVAGGGGGGGGQGEFDDYTGGPGGDGVGGEGAGTPAGEDGWTAPFVPKTQYLGGDGGPARLGDHQGGDGTHAPVVTPLLGGGGGGGGGASGGDGGGVFVPVPGKPLSIFGGGGGGGGSSYTAPGAQDVQFTVADGDCPVGGGPPACHGTVTLSWIPVPAHVTPQGPGQSAVVTTRFPHRLDVRVTAATGEPVPGTPVAFALPAAGPSGRFGAATGPTTAVATTDANGFASSPPVIADGTGGAWTATASVAQDGVPPARLAMRNERATTATAAYASPSPSQTGEPVHLSAVVAATPSSAGPPSGTVEFRVDGDPVGAPVALDGLGTATSEPVALGPGDHHVTVAYSGSRSARPSDAALTQPVHRAPTAIALTSSQNPAPDGAPVTFDAAVRAVAPAGGTPTGRVRFVLDGDALGTVDLVGGRAEIVPAVGDLPEGTHVVEAIFEGDAGYVESTAAIAQVIGAGVTAITVSSSAEPSAFGEPLTLTAHVAADAPGVPTGAVDVRVDGAVVCGGVTLDAGAAARCEVDPPPAAGTHDVVATYSGDATFAASEGHARQRIDPARTLLGVLATPDPSRYGDAVTLHADVSVRGPGAGTPTGSVEFRVDGALVGPPVALTADGATSPPLTGLTGGPHTVEARYGGAADFGPAHAARAVVVDRADLGAMLTAAPDPAREGDAVVATVRLTPASGAGEEPRGHVRFHVDGEPHGDPVPLRRGVAASAPITGLSGGVHELRATYAGSEDYEPAEADLELAVGDPAPAPAPTPAGGPGPAPGAAAPPAGPELPIPLVPSGEAGSGSCAVPVAITAVRRSGRHLRIAGWADPDLAGRRVTIERAGRRLGRARVARDGRFDVRARRPGGRAWRAARVRAVVAGRRSPRVRLGRRLAVAAPTALPGGAARVQARLARGGARRVVVTRLPVCRDGRRERVGVVRSDGRGRVAVTLPGPGWYRLRAGRGASSLPVVVGDPPWSPATP
ncbi:MAG TPA: Ig-like domain repeat protein [Capillimicrobium sp.]|nr:Ig-like domain repeat protein [Capillimicrobium sp.]